MNPKRKEKKCLSLVPKKSKFSKYLRVRSCLRCENENQNKPKLRVCDGGKGSLLFL